MKAPLWALVVFFCFCFYSNARAEVNQYGVDCSLTPWFSSCESNGNSGEFIDPSGNDVTQHMLGDDSTVGVALPFNFSMYGRTFVYSWMHSNGVVSFLSVPVNPEIEQYNSYGTGGAFCCNGEDLVGILNGTSSGYYGTASGYPHNIPYISYSIAALWTDLININKDLDGDGINDTGFFTQPRDTDGDGSYDTMRYYYRNISEFYDAQTNNTFGVQIDSQNGIEIHYFEVDIRNHTVTIAITGDLDQGEVQQFVYYQQNGQTDFTMSNIQGLEDAVQNGGATILNFNLAGACAANPLISENCSGYAEAYAELVYESNCKADPLYDSGCQGYEEAYYTQQCTLNPLYDTGCSGYETAYFNQQCSLDPLYDVTCSGYEQAYFTQQCSLDPLYNEGCDGYATAYYDQQCSLNPLYDTGCPGYETAYYNQQCTIDALYDTGCPGYETAYIESQCELNALYSPSCSGYAAAMAEQEQTETAVTTNVTPEASSTGDAVVDEVISTPDVTASVTNPASPINILTIEPAIEAPVVIEPPVEVTVEELPQQQEEQAEEILIAELGLEDDKGTEEPSSHVEEQVEDSGSTEDNEPKDEQGGDETSNGSGGGNESSVSEPKKPLTAQQKLEARKKKIKEIAVAKATQLAERMSEAASLEAQKAVQQQVLALINYNPDFQDYAKMGLQELDFYNQQQMPDGEIDKRTRGLRNGLAQQLLHQQMVDMQYER